MYVRTYLCVCVCVTNKHESKRRRNSALTNYIVQTNVGRLGIVGEVSLAFDNMISFYILAVLIELTQVLKRQLFYRGCRKGRDKHLKS